MNDVLVWTGMATWVICSALGLYWLIDSLAEWFIDSAKFKAYVIGYLTQRKRFTDAADQSSTRETQK